MPTISMFYGIIIKMFFDDHAPPHFHVEYAEFKALVNIKDLFIMEGCLPKRAEAMVLDWAAHHQSELIEDWNLCMKRSQPKPIQPLL
jgi:hypothetical protein